MKPAEILAMVEEAAGTRMFEDRKEKAVKVMGKKETKMDEIQNLLTTEIQPKLASLRDKKRDFLEFQKLETELSQINNFLVAYDFWNCERKLQSFEQESLALRTRISEHEASDRSLKDENNHISNMIEALTENKQNVIVAITNFKFSLILMRRLQNDGAFHKLDAEVKEISKELVKINTQVELKKSSIKDEIASLKALEKSRQDGTRSLNTLSKSVADVQIAFDGKKAEYDTRTRNLEKKQDLLQTLTTGVASSKGHENGYMDQLRVATSTIEQAKIKITHLNEELKIKGPKAKKAQELNKNVVESLAQKRQEVATIWAKVDAMAVPDIDALYEKKAGQSNLVSNLKKQLQKIERDIQAYLFHYTNQANTINSEDVKGVIAELIQIPVENLESVMAIETCAGGRLYNVVVSTDIVSTKLLDKTQTKLGKKVSIIPLNKIKSANIDPARITNAKEISPGKVELALDLLQFDLEVLNAMKFVFGSTLICKDTNSAKQVTFDQRVKMKSVTLDGDVYDPQGTLSGGSRPKSSNILLKFQEYNTVRKDMRKENLILERLCDEIQKAEVVVEKHRSARKQLELGEHECGLLEGQISSNTNSQIILQVEAIKSEIETQTKRIEGVSAQTIELNERCKSLERDMKQFSSNKEETLESLKKEIQTEKKTLVSETKKIQAEELKLQTVVQEKLLLEQEIQGFDANETQLKASIDFLNAELAEMKIRQSDLKETIKVREEKLAIERKVIMSHDSEMQVYEKTRKSNQKKISDISVALIELKTKLENGATECNRAVARLEDIKANKENSWIGDLKTQFGIPDGRFDFAQQNIPDLRKKLQQLAERHKATSRTLDRTVMEQFDRIEKKESALVQKITMVLKDKTKIEDTIDSLEKYKIDKLIQTWEKVSRDFGLIFSDLLPGNTAKLVPTDGKNIGSGLEVQVSLGGVWKENLTELSGGQRSLVALSLILALLQFKPAPMYILDEVDSALDESHTQNIGQLLRTRFNGAQFILVSLKDGMYTNANVLFRTKFRDGVSTIERFSQNSSNSSGKQRK
ncbi:Structural maintenance of chromosomes protein 2 [Physocladia obscura]|uniref:Structural maintenance of chromosomes protein 2 n=1 Tax=Physocladia obscura TaxID=109957 RepID=A0AAD5T0L6_9FUNG|nr:Structural maintenance of chromosomes protein 2 [Physocladia obscura]